MKKFTVIVLAIALIAMMSVPFTAGAAAEEATFTVTAGEVVDGNVTVDITYTAAENVYLLNGQFTVNFDATKLELVVGEKVGPIDPANQLAKLQNALGAAVGAQVNVDKKDEGEILVAFMDDTGLAAEGTLLSLPFAVKDGATGDVAVTLTVDELKKWDENDASGLDVFDMTAGEVTVDDTVELAAPTTTTTTTTAAPTTTTTTTAAPTTTKKAEPMGEATPWALMATVAVAGAALVVLSTKKSK